MQLILQEEIITLLAQKAIWLPKHHMLVVADLHLGKITHFRKAGLYMPAVNGRTDVAILQQLCQEYHPRYLVFLGDLFHSHINSEWKLLEGLLAANPQITAVLTQGNHDIIPKDIFLHARISVVDELVSGNLLLTHQPAATVLPGMLNIAGHIHPGYLVKAPGRQYYRLPCFYQQAQTLLVPAFGKYTGLHLVHKEADNQIYVIAGHDIYRV